MKTWEKEPQFKIGQQFIKQRPKNEVIETITDILITKNNAGEIVKIRYVAAHEFMSQILTDYDVIGTTIARGLITE